MLGGNARDYVNDTMFSFLEEIDVSKDYTSSDEFPEMFPEAFPNLHSIFQQEKEAENQGVNKERKEELRGTELTKKERPNENKCQNSDALTEKDTLQADNKGDSYIVFS